jgi:lysophospholipase L1-like esterase
VRRSKGYTPLYGNKVAKNSKDVDEKHRLKNAELMETLKKFLGKAKEKGINVYVIVSPTTQSYSYSSIPEIKKITESGGYKFFNFSHLPEFNDLSLFYDNTHLNAKGATKFTEIVLKSLKL